MKKFVVILSLLFGLLNGSSAWGQSLRSLSALAASRGADVTVVLPVHQAGDILLLQGWVRDADDSAAVVGWTAITGTPFDSVTTSARYWQFWKRATSVAETNPTFDKSTTTGDTYAAVAVYQGAVASGDPWNVIGAPQSGFTMPAATGQEVAVLSGIVTSVPSLIIAAVATDNNSNNSAGTISPGDPIQYDTHYMESNMGADGALTFSEGHQVNFGFVPEVFVYWDNEPAPAGAVHWGGLLLALTPAP